MVLFGIREASHFCSSFSPRGGVATRSLDEYQKNQLRNRSIVLREGTPEFENYRSCSIREVERCLFLAASHYRRFLDLLIPSACHWASVTLYYGSWYASHALLGMFGCSIFQRSVIDVQNSTPGRQELRLRTIGSGTNQQPTTYNRASSHKIYWDLFYEAVRRLDPMVSPKLSIALNPINNDRAWQIDYRNGINYDSLKGCELALSFENSFSGSSFPSSLPGMLATQYKVNEALLELAFQYARIFNIQTDALNGFGQSSSLVDKVNALIYSKKPPSLVGKTRKSNIFP